MTLVRETFEALTTGAEYTGGDGWVYVSNVTNANAPRTISTTQKMHGSKSLRIQADASENGYMYRLRPAATLLDSLSWYFRADAAPSAETTLVEWRNATTYAQRVTWLADGRLQAVAAGGAAFTPFGTAITAQAPTSGFWRLDCRIEVGTTTSNGVFVAELYDGDSTTAVRTYSSSARNTGTTELTEVRLGKINGTTGALYLYIDDPSADDGRNTLIGPAPTEALPIVSVPDNFTVEPFDAFTLTATSSTGSVTWSKVSGDGVAPSSTGALTASVSKAFPSLAGGSAVYRASATNGAGATTRDVTVTFLPATDALMTTGGLVPVRLVGPS